MDESFVCECGNDTFLFFWDKVRCTECWNEYKQTKKKVEYINPYSERDGEVSEKSEKWLRRYNMLEMRHNPNWEKSKNTYKNGT